jgi:hypothetical protein
MRQLQAVAHGEPQIMIKLTLSLSDLSQGCSRLDGSGPD